MTRNRGVIIQVAIVAIAFGSGAALAHFFSESKQLGQPTTKIDLAQPAPVTLALKPAEVAPDLATDAKVAVRARSLEEIMRDRNASNRTAELEAFAKNIATSQIGAALKQLRRMPDSSARDLATRLLAAQWVESDREGALQFAIQNHEFDYLASDVLQQMAADNLQSALERAKNITDPDARYQALRGVLSFMADEDPLGALQLAGTLGSFPNEEPLNQMVYRQWSSVDPQAAALRAAQDPQSGNWRSPVNQVLRNWASQDPLAAIAWSSTVTDPAAQARDIAQIVHQWSRTDLNAAANWVNSVPTGDVRDAAVAALALSIGMTDPSAALGWAEAITDQAKRETALRRLSGQIMFHDPTNGPAILAAAGVPQRLIPQR